MRALTQPSRWKFSIPLKEMAKRTGWSESKVKRVSAKHPEIIEAILEGKPTEVPPQTLIEYAGKLYSLWDAVFVQYVRFASIRSELRESHPEVAKKLDLPITALEHSLELTHSMAVLYAKEAREFIADLSES